jgi:2-polyprenyl-6-methoxyphenol hydroxylase-like FAD-dependent oxidoreductase
MFVVVGGGIGGLAAALGLARVGRSVTVLEKAPEFGEVGAGLQLGPNASRMLDKLGVLDAVHQAAVFPRRLAMYDIHDGKQIAKLDLGRKFKDRANPPLATLRSKTSRGVVLSFWETPPTPRSNISLKAPARHSRTRYAFPRWSANMAMT